jgi:hypothetical protein
MQVVTPGEGSYLMPVTWYFAPTGAKTFTGINAFGSGVWDRDTPALPPQLGAQPPYNSPYYNGKNVWGYRGLCRIGTDDQFANGLTQHEATGLPPPPQSSIPDCCRPALPNFDCPAYPEGLPRNFNALIVPKYGTVIPPQHAIAFQQFTLVPDVPCRYVGPFWDLGLSSKNAVILEFTLTQVTASLFYSNHTPPVIWGAFGRFPALFKLPQNPPVDLGFLDFRESILIIVPYPEDVPVQPIVIAGDVIGTGDLTPAGVTIPTTLVNIITAGTAGDASHVPVITFDAKGRVVAASQVPIASAGLNIGDAVGGSTPNAVLFVDVSNNLADSGAFTFDGTNVSIGGPGLVVLPSGGRQVVMSDGTRYANFVDGVQAANFRDPLHTVNICDGTNAILYTWSGGSPIWNGTPPTDVWVALERLAGWMAANFPLLPLP